MRIMLTGATGMIGSAIVRMALAEQDSVLCIVRKGTKRLGNIPASPSVSVVECDASGYHSLTVEGTYDVCIHLAWDKTFGQGRDQVDSQLANIQYTLDAVRLAKRSGCSVFVGAGSQAEYGPVTVDLKGDTPVHPESGYGIAKYAAGSFSRLLCSQLGLRFNWLRILSVYGPHDGKQTLISYVIDCLQRGVSPELTKCEQLWDYCYADDIARAFLAVAHRGRDGMTYPLGSGQGHQFSWYVETIRNLVAPDVALRFGVKPYYPHQPMHLVADISELTNDTGWRPQVSFADGIRKIVQH